MTIQQTVRIPKYKIQIATELKLTLHFRKDVEIKEDFNW